MGSIPLNSCATKPPGVRTWTKPRTARFCGLSAGKTSGLVSANPYIGGMQKTAVTLLLLAFLAASIWFAYHVWATDEGPPIPTMGYVAMGLGILFSLLVGIGLMA